MEIRITPKALWDIDNIFEYFISNDEKDVWNSFWVNLKSVFGMISIFPDAGSPRFKDFSDDFELRYLSVRKFKHKVFYRVDYENNRIYILRIIHPSRDMESVGLL